MLFYKLFYYFEVWEYYNLAPINVYLATIHILNFSQTGIISTANNIYPTLWLLMSMSEILRDYFQRWMNTHVIIYSRRNVYGRMTQNKQSVYCCSGRKQQRVGNHLIVRVMKL